MTECWNEGGLRAYVDRELAPDEMTRLGEHMEACPECRARHAEIAARAGRVDGAIRCLAAAPAASRPAARAVWLRRAASVALAAALALVFLYAPAKPPAAAQAPRNFIALDNEPIETGLVVRMAFGPDQVQADVIISPDGRPRAYRLVDNLSN